VSNSSQESISTNTINENVNDYLYYQIFVKNKKTQKINMKKHVDFIEKHNTLITKKTNTVNQNPVESTNK
jgi:hypothetical protein